MEKFVIEINKRIADKCNKLKSKAEMAFGSISLDAHYLPVHSSGSNRHGLSAYLLYGVSAISLIYFFVTDDYKAASLLVCTGSLFGGYKLSRPNSKSNLSKPSSTNLLMLKNRLSSQIIETVKSVTNEWDAFMEDIQSEMRNQINSLDIPQEKKNSLLSRIFTFEIVDISISDFTDKLNNIQNAQSLSLQFKQLRRDYLHQLTGAIEKAAMKQIGKYQGLVIS